MMINETKGFPRIVSKKSHKRARCNNCGSDNCQIIEVITDYRLEENYESITHSTEGSGSLLILKQLKEAQNETK